MIKVLFLIHDLGQGGAEKVLVNLVNNMNTNIYDVTVMSLFDVGENRQFLSERIHYKYCFKHMIRGNSHLMKVFSGEFLHERLIKEKYDIEIAYLEGPSTRIISGCPDKNTKLITWLHFTPKSFKELAYSFRNISETQSCYKKFDRIVTVSEEVKQAFMKVSQFDKEVSVIYNTNDSEKITRLCEKKAKTWFSKETFNIICVGKLTPNKGGDRMINIIERLRKNKKDVHLYLLGDGEQKTALSEMARAKGLEKYVTFLGFQDNPYQYVKQADLFVCASHSEGFSTATTEALILGVPVCTVEVSGMKEMLGQHNEYGVVVKNDDESLYHGINRLIENPSILEYYKEMASIRGEMFSTEKTVKSVEDMLDNI